MPLPIATIGLTLAAAGLRIFGPESKLLEFAAHPLDLLAGHLAAENLEEVAARLRERFQAYERITNEDLDRAVTRSALLASLFCLLDALPQEPTGVGPAQQLRLRLKTWLPSNTLQGVISRAKESTINPAIAACERQLEEVKEGTLAYTEIDPLRLILPERGMDWGVMLASEALASLQHEHGNLPEELSTVFRERWFPYLCLAFQDQIKTGERVSRIFQSVQTATGFAQLEDVIHQEHEKTRDLVERVYQRQLDEALAANRITAEEARRANKERSTWQERYVSLVEAQQRKPDEGAFTSLIVEGNLTAAARLKESEIKRRLRELAQLPRDWYELGTVNELRHALPEALDAYQQAIALYRATSASAAHRLGLALGLCSSASCLMGLRKVSESLASLGEAMEICPVLVPLSEDPQIVACRREEIRLLKKLVAELCMVGLFAKIFSGEPPDDPIVKEGKLVGGSSYPSYKRGLEALKLRPNPFWPSIAEQLGQLAMVCCEVTKNPVDAEGFSWAGAELYRVLAQAEPETFGAQFALALNNLAHILNKFGFRHPDPVEVAKESLEAYTSLTQPKPDGVAMALDTLGECLETRGRDNEALTSYSRGIDTLLPEFVKQPVALQDLMRDLLERYQRLASKLGQFLISKSLQTAAEVLQSLPPHGTEQPPNAAEQRQS